MTKNVSYRWTTAIMTGKNNQKLENKINICQLSAQTVCGVDKKIEMFYAAKTTNAFHFIPWVWSMDTTSRCGW